MPISTGHYFIINVQTKNRAYLPNPNSEEPIQGRFRQHELGEQWIITKHDNGHHTIKNIGHKQYAASGSRSPQGELVKGWERYQTWLIQKTTGKGQYTISTTDTKIFWGLVDGEQGTPIALADAPTNQHYWWMFKDVETGNDAKVDQDLENETAANATIPRAAFQTESQIHMQLDVKDISKKLDDATLNSLPNHPRYDAVDYLDKSRDDALQHISAWIDKPEEPILWIFGAAGLGKSTTSQQLVRLLKSDNCLAGGVFLTNLTKEHPEIVIQMISRQLGEMHPRAIANIAEAARKLNGPHNPLRDYFTAYIIDPISQLKYPYQLVVVLDGLEEWANHEAFLAELAHLPTPSPVKFILTSRPSYSVERVLNKIAIQRYIQRYPLPPVSQEIVERYFAHHFAERIDWKGRKPDQLIINRLAMHAQGLLIWAATVCSLLSHKFDERRPHEILERILWSEEKVGAQSGKQLERLYHGAISTLFPEDMRERLRNFLGAMMALQEPLPVGDFARLLGMPVHLAEEIQQQLAAFQTRGEFKSSIVPPAIQQFHFSFLEFMESPSTEHNGQPIATDTANAHSMLANRCLEIVFSEFLPSYRGTICGYSELRGVELYAVKFWPLHLSNGTSRLPPPSPSPSKDPMDMISEQDMRRWATLFLPCVAARFQESHGYDSLDNTPRSSVPFQLAMIIGEDDVTTLSYQLHCLEIAVRLEPIDVPTLMVLGCAYGRLYQHGRKLQSLDEEISIFRRALLLLPAPHLDRWLSLNELAQTLLTRFQHRGVSSDLDEAILFSQEALPLQPAPHPDCCMALNTLANALLARFQHRGDLSDLDKAILFFQEILLLPAPHPDRWMSLNNLANVLYTRFENRGVPSDLDEAISLYQAALLLRPVPHPHRWTSLNNLANVLGTRFQHRSVPSDLDEAIVFYQEALLLSPAPHPVRSMSLNGLAEALHTRFVHRGVPTDLDEAISFDQEALLLQPAPHPARWMSLCNLANSLCTRFKHRSVSSDLDEAISIDKEALLLLPAPHPGRSKLLNNLANALRTRFEHRSVPSDLKEAILLHKEALLLRPVPHPDRLTSLSNLEIALRTCFEHWGVPSDLDKAISFNQEALLLLPAPHPDRSKLLNNLANALCTRFEHRSVPSDLDEAISLYQALLLLPAPHLDRWLSLNELAQTLLTRFQHRGVSSDLDKAISFNQEALLLQPVLHPERWTLLDNLALVLYTRYEHQSISSDLDEAISFFREALLLRPVSHPHRWTSLNNLANVLCIRFNHRGVPSDLDEAISFDQEALLLLPALHPDRLEPLNCLAGALWNRFKHRGVSTDSSDLDEAIRFIREALLVRPAHHPDYSKLLNNLAMALQTRSELQGTINDREDANSSLDSLD